MRTLAAAALLLAPRAAQACSVCFGGAKEQQGLANGFWWGIVVLLSVTMTLVAGIGYLLWTVEKGRSEAEA